MSLRLFITYRPQRYKIFLIIMLVTPLTPVRRPTPWDSLSHGVGQIISLTYFCDTLCAFPPTGVPCCCLAIGPYPPYDNAETGENSQKRDLPTLT